MGFEVIVHMSADAKHGKRTSPDKNGVTIVEHDADFSVALHEGKKQAEKMENSYFIDDENSENLFLVCSGRIPLRTIWMTLHGIIVDNDDPLFVYLPCGVGRSPGGVTYGLKSIYHDMYTAFSRFHSSPRQCYLFTHTGLRNQIHVHHFGIIIRQRQMD